MAGYRRVGQGMAGGMNLCKYRSTNKDFLSLFESGTIVNAVQVSIKLLLSPFSHVFCCFFNAVRENKV